MIKSSFFNSVSHDRRYKAEDWAEYFAAFIKNGIFPLPSNGLQVMSAGDMKIVIKTGKIWINGYYAHNTSDYEINLADYVDGTYNKYVRIVMQWNRQNRIVVSLEKVGIPATQPTAPAIQRDADVYEMALADVYIGKGAIQITQANITDLRLNSELCGIAQGIIQQADTTTLYNQIQSDLLNFQQQEQSEFLAWFESIKDILDEDTAGNLLDMINKILDGTTPATKAKQLETPRNITLEGNTSGSVAFDGTADVTINTTVGYAASAPWAGVTGKPVSYLPSSHTHAASQVTAGTFPSGQYAVTRGAAAGGGAYLQNTHVPNFGNTGVNFVIFYT